MYLPLKMLRFQPAMLFSFGFVGTSHEPTEASLEEGKIIQIDQKAKKLQSPAKKSRSLISG